MDHLLIQSCISKMGPGDTPQPKECATYSTPMLFSSGSGFSTPLKKIFFRFSNFRNSDFRPSMHRDRQSSISTSGYPKIRTSKIWNRKNMFFFRGENPHPRGKYMHIAYISHCFGCRISPAPSFEIQARIIRWSLGALAQIGPYSPLK